VGGFGHEIDQVEFAPSVVFVDSQDLPGVRADFVDRGETSADLGVSEEVVTNETVCEVIAVVGFSPVHSFFVASLMSFSTSFSAAL
jgi:hypothetical protein